MKTRKKLVGFDERLKNAMYKRDIGPVELSSKTGIPRSTLYYYMWEDVMPQAFNVRALAEVLNVSSDYLLGLKENIDD